MNPILDLIILVIFGLFIYTRFFGHKLPKAPKKRGTKGASPFERRPNTPPRRQKAEDDDAEEAPSPRAAHAAAAANVASLEKKRRAALASLEGLDKVKTVDTSFSEKEFLDGARQAYRMYAEAWQMRDEDALEALLAPKLFDTTMEAMDAAMDAGKRPLFEVKRILSADIVDARVHGKTVILDVKYTADVARWVTDEDGKLLEGDPQKGKREQTIWTWARSTTSDDPNWELEEMKPLS